ncbi:hypothetical protein MPER_12102 [Moniliophthora perniciosa FA553]|nr:hypothetical protein MPER_12102 [Moniliophthora perniciosa FA553]
MCLSLKGRTWTPITVTTKLDNSDVGTSPESDESKTLDGASEILPNIDGDRPFLVVIRPVQEPNSPMLITDQWGSFTVYLQESQDPTSHAEVMNVMQGRHEVYRWAKRSSNLQFSVCLDGAPVTDPVW